jgi:hypothetical protein
MAVLFWNGTQTVMVVLFWNGVTDRQIGVEDGQTGGRNRDDDDGMMAVAVLF